MSAMAVAALAVAAGQAIPASASAAAKPAQQPSGQAAGSVDSKLVKPSEKTGVVPGTVIAVLSGPSVTGTRLRADSTMLAPKTSSAVVNTALSRLGATSIQPLFGGLSSAAAQTLTSSARQKIGASALNLGNIVVVHVTKSSATAAAKTLAATSGVSFAEPDRYVETMDTGGQTLTTGSAGSTGIKATPLKAADVKAVTPGAAALPATTVLSPRSIAT